MEREDKSKLLDKNEEVKHIIPNHLVKQEGLGSVRIPENVTHIKGEPFGDIWDRIEENNKRFKKC